MKVSSPVGDFPFEAQRLRYEDRALVIEGSMGAWPAEIRVTSDDVPMLVRLVPRPMLAVLASGSTPRRPHCQRSSAARWGPK